MNDLKALEMEDLLSDLPDVPGWNKGSNDILSDIPDVSANHPKYENASFLRKLPANIAAGLGQLGHNILGESHREWSQIAPFIAKYIPQQPEYDYSQMLGLPGTTADKLVQGLAKNSLMMASPAGELGVAGKAISAIPKAGEFLAGAASRIAPQAALGAISSENPEAGAKHAALIQAALEALPLPFKGAKAFAEAVNPVEYAGKELEKIRGGLRSSEQAEKEAYKPFNEIAGQYKFKKPENYNEVLEESKEYFTPYIKKLNEKFQEQPTLANAHKLQSQMFTDIKKLSKGEGQGVLDKIQGINTAREALNKDVYGVLRHIDKDVAKSYKEGARIHREEIQPHYSNPELAKLITGEIDKLKPGRLQRAITKAKEENKIPEGHPLRKSLEDVTAKLNQGKALQYGLPTLAGAALGHFGGYHGALPLGLGAGLGAYAGHGAGKIAELIQNPEVANLLTKLAGWGKRAQPIVRGILD
jgi:hypothetical protein